MDSLPPRLKMPLFMTTRVRFRPEVPKDSLYNHISKNRKTYLRDSCKSKPHDVGLDKEEPFTGRCIVPPIDKTSRDLVIERPWQLPANRYGVPKEPYGRLKGTAGSFWLPLRKPKRPRVEKSKIDWKFYDRTSEVERLNDRENAHKGIFLYNLRYNRPTARSMVDNLSSCYKNPSEPTATTYYYKNFEVGNNLYDGMKKPKRPNPHVFLRYSCVPAKHNINHKRHISFVPGPGRYETRYRITCGCSSKFIYRPDLEQAIEREKRLKFRKLPYDKIKASMFCSPEWRHIAGNGHSWLFKNIPPKPVKVSAAPAKKSNKDVQLHADAEYIHMILNPLRQPMTKRISTVHRPRREIRYNCLAKRVARKQLRNNKKLAFMSGQERFKDMDRPPVLTLAQREAAKASLPPERQLHDRPITRVPIRKIKPKVYESVKPHRPLIELARKPFRFLPAPITKLLVTEKDLRMPRESSIPDDMPQGFFRRTLIMADYFKDEYKNRARI